MMGDLYIGYDVCSNAVAFDVWEVAQGDEFKKINVLFCAD